MAIAEPGGRHGLHPLAGKPRDLSVVTSLGMCLLAAILMGLTGWITFEILMTLITLD
jgi:hypothetical protein